MSTQLDLAKGRLFDEDELATANFKLYPGTNRDSTPEEVAEQINKAISQIRAGDAQEVTSYED